MGNLCIEVSTVKRLLPVALALVVVIPCITTSAKAGFFLEGPKREEIIKDVVSYNQQIFKRKVHSCKIVNNDATCAGKGYGYILICQGAGQKFKWFKYPVGDRETHVYTLPMSYTDYNCNPSMPYEKALFPRIKRGSYWRCENASSDWAPPHCN